MGNEKKGVEKETDGVCGFFTNQNKPPKIIYLVGHGNKHAEVAKHQLHGIEEAHAEDLWRRGEMLDQCAHLAPQVGQILCEDAQ